MTREIIGPDLLTPAEVAQLLRVDPKTVTRWAKAGRLSSVRTVGGHRRFFRSEIIAYLEPDRQPYGPISHHPKNPS